MFYFEAGFHYVAQASLELSVAQVDFELVIILPSPPEC
jgi:hypothetical protein